jgi:hypothetical protein
MTDKVFSDIGKYVRVRRQKLAGRMATLTRIYLDTNFWLFVRDAYAGRPRNDTHRLLYEKLLQLVRSGRAICPATDTVLHEVFHQNDSHTRLMTARIIDELSAGIALDQTEQRVRIEILHFLRSCRQSADTLAKLSDWVWTPACWTLGEMHPYLAHVSSEVQTRLQVGFSEEMAKRGIADIVESLAPASEPLPRAFLDNLSRKLNEGKMRHADEIHNLKQAFMMELEGVLDVYRDDIADALTHISNSEVVATAQVETEIEVVKELFRTGKLGTSLPFFNTQVGLHAVFRWNRGQKFKSNDWLDYYHAGAALPYFDIFLTEKALASTVTSPALGYDSLYGTRVCSDPAEALDILETV